MRSCSSFRLSLISSSWNLDPWRELPSSDPAAAPAELCCEHGLV